ncbi:tetratricopeptide repeat protein [Pseudomonas sp. ABC1]|uniref:tetratricopeptide repeat protein n=1 Tax=Pseudomonas sp. ABC1 TaxID=2748080 RepID=UPI0015C31BCB|nr:tetratricopeptide repeat protein [Pseudomonas sp. ABC1]QLF94776.1 tetratricopeptide repeat protein [Pseudomonas sp. ABC1]
MLPELLRPAWLLCLPLLGWALWRLWHRQRKVGRWQRLIPRAFHGTLLTRGRSRNSRLPWIVLGLGWLIACLALLGPSWQRIEQPSLKRADPLVVLLETTSSTLATDVPPNRLVQARHKLIDLLRSRQDAQTAIIAYAGSAHTLVPLSDDLTTAQHLLDVLHPRLMPEPGQRADLAVAQGLELIEQAAQGAGRLLLIGSSLSPQEREGIERLLQKHDGELLMLGIGTPEGAPVEQEDGQFLKNADGSILIPGLDSASLAAFIEGLGGRYQVARLDDSDFEHLGLLDAHGKPVVREESAHLNRWLDQGYWLLLPLLLLAACAGRRGWLFCLPLLLIEPPTAYALQWQDLWARPDQQGQALLHQGHPAQAAERFNNRQWRAQALYLAGDFSAAAELLADSDDAIDHYNRGNALARAEQFPAAIEAYEQALELDPQLQQAQHNKALLEELLRSQPEPSEPQTTSAEEESVDSGANTEPPRTAAPSNNQEKPDDDSAPAQATQEPDASPQAGAEQDSDMQPVPLEQEQALQQWLRQIPDDPGELLRRKFLYEQRKRQEPNR